MAFTVTLATAASTGTSATLTKPTGTADGDLLVFAWCADNNSASTPTFNGSSLTSLGWTQIGTTQSTSVVDGQAFEVWRKVASSEPSSWAVVASAEFSSIVARVTGQGATPIDVSLVTQDTSAQSGSALNTNSSGVTTANDGDLLLFIGTVDFNAAGTITATVPSGYTSAGLATSGAWTALQVAYATQTTHGATGAVNGVLTNTNASSGASQTALIAINAGVSGPQTYNVGVTEAGASADGTSATGGSVLALVEMASAADVFGANSKLLDFIGVSSGGDSSSSASSVSATVPSGDVVGMLEIIYFASAVASPATAPTHTTPTGFTLLGTGTATVGGTALNDRLSVFGRILTAAPAAVTLNCSANAAMAWTRACYANPAASYFGQVVIAKFASSTTPSVASITTTKANALVSIFTTQAAAQGYAPPSGFTARLTNTTNGVGLMDEVMATAGATGSKTITLPSAADGITAIMELWPLVSGSIYFSADNEAGAATDGATAIFSVGLAQAEIGAAVDSINTGGGSTYPVTASESGVAADVVSGALSTTQATTESVAASDTNTAAMVAAQAVAEAGTAAETTSDAIGTTQTIAESGAAIDVTNDQLTATAAAAETGAATDSTDRLLLTPAAALEAGAATDASATTQVAAQAVVESGAAADASSGVGATASTISEIGDAVDIEGVIAGGIVAMAEAGATSDSASAAMTTPQTIVEVGVATDNGVGSLVTSAAAAEAGAASDSATAGGVSLQGLVDAGATSDTTTGGVSTGLSAVESGSAADAAAALAAGVLLVSDAGAVADGLALSAVFSPTLADGMATADTPTASSTTGVGLAEAAASLDTTDSQRAIWAPIAEVSIAADVVGSFVALVSALVDALAAQDDAATAGIVDAAASEAGAAEDIGSVGIAFSDDVAEGLTASEVLTLLFLLWAHTGAGDVWYVDARSTAASDGDRTTSTSIDHRNTAA